MLPVTSAMVALSPMAPLRSGPLAIFSMAARVPAVQSRMSATTAGSQTTAAMQSYSKLKALLREVSALSEVEGVLSYDEQVFMPTGAAASRTAQKAALAKLVHNLKTGEDMRAAVESVRGREDEFDDARVRANVRDAIDAFDKEARKSSTQHGTVSPLVAIFCTPPSWPNPIEMSRIRTMFLMLSDLLTPYEVCTYVLSGGTVSCINR